MTNLSSYNSGLENIKGMCSYLPEFKVKRLAIEREASLKLTEQKV